MSVLDRLRRHPVAVAGVVLAGTAALAFGLRPSRLDPVAWHPPDPPELAGPLAENEALTDARRVVALDGPEDVAFDEDGRLYAGTEDGAIHRTVDPVEGSPTDAETETFASVEGRPLAVEFDGDRLLVAAVGAGLLSVDPDGTVTTLADTAGGRPIAFADDVFVDPEGPIYFTDATEHGQFQDELFELRDTGRLLAYHPDTGDVVESLHDPTGDLHFLTSATPHEGTLYLGTLVGDGVYACELD